MRVFLTSILLFGSVLAAPSKTNSPPDTLVITNANIVDVRNGQILSSKTVVIKNSRIDSIAKVGMIALSKHMHVVNASGKYLVPGLWDMHVHSAGGTAGPWDDKVILPLYIANGITGIRDMGGDPAILERRKRSIENGELLGPHMVIAGPFLAGGKSDNQTIGVRTSADGIAAVDSLKNRGMDFIKILSNLSREAYLAIAAESARQKIPFVGHVPDSVRVEEASSAGQKTIEHLTGVLLGCSLQEDDLRRRRLEALDKKDWVAYASIEARVSDTYSPDKAGKLFAEFINHNTWQVPTLVWDEADANIDKPDLSSDPRLKYVPAAIAKQWEPAGLLARTTPDQLAQSKRVTARYIELVGALRKAGVSIMAGSDSPDPYVFPGSSLHEELELLVEAGFTPLQALQAATYHPARFMNHLDRYGVIEKDRAADLVLLNENPLSDIRNTRKIAGVVRDGKFYSREDLDKMLQQVEKAAAAQ